MKEKAEMVQPMVPVTREQKALYEKIMAVAALTPVLAAEPALTVSMQVVPAAVVAVPVLLSSNTRTQAHK